MKLVSLFLAGSLVLSAQTVEELALAREVKALAEKSDKQLLEINQLKKSIISDNTRTNNHSDSTLNAINDSSAVLKKTIEDKDYDARQAALKSQIAQDQLIIEALKAKEVSDKLLKEANTTNFTVIMGFITVISGYAFKAYVDWRNHKWLKDEAIIASRKIRETSEIVEVTKELTIQNQERLDVIENKTTKIADILLKPRSTGWGG